MSTSIYKKVAGIMKASSVTRRKILYERLRLKVAEDILAVMKEAEIGLEQLAKKMGMRKEEVSCWIWERDLKLSEIVQILDRLDAEFYPLIRDKAIRKAKEIG